MVWGSLSFYLAHLGLWGWDTLQQLNLLPIQLTHPLETVCVLLLDLVVALTKFLLVWVLSLEDALAQAHLLSWQPSSRAFHWQSFMTSFLHWSQPICNLFRLENPFLTVSKTSIVMSHNTLVTYTDKNSIPMLTRSNLLLLNSNIQLLTSEPLDKLWPVPSLVTHPDNPWFQVLSYTLQQTLTNSKSCHTFLSHAFVTSHCHTPLAIHPHFSAWD